MTRRLVIVLATWAVCVGSAVLLAASASASASVTALTANHSLFVGQRLVSPHGRYYAAVEPSGALVVRSASSGIATWWSPQVGRNAHVNLGGSGQLVLSAPGGQVWRSRTKNSGHADVLTVSDTGVLVLTADRMLVWTNRIGSACPWSSGTLFVVDISAQFARACDGGQQLRAAYVTTGMSARGYGTPTGTWRVQAKVRDTTLYPAAGGAYPVNYWMPYDGVYGLHDSPWQNFPYGSDLYRTRGSHGCTHVPERLMAWVFAWARVGSTVVTIHA